MHFAPRGVAGLARCGGGMQSVRRRHTHSHSTKHPPRHAPRRRTVVNNTTVVAPPEVGGFGYGGYGYGMMPFGGFGIGMPMFLPFGFFGGMLQIMFLLVIVNMVQLRLEAVEDLPGGQVRARVGTHTQLQAAPPAWPGTLQAAQLSLWRVPP